ncbi:2-phosphosulfolactate phosphatase, partial [Candidatus Bathyarchaeota archaeon]|nr:2-phosphosulfolactate phosphatase [Candidatus Bathyarchaeota archaeon]
MRKVNAELMAKDAIRGGRRGDVVVLIDVLRCTSAIVTALANGATDVIAVKSVSRARSLKSRNPDSILAGERGGLPPRGFELGNSPLDFSAKKVRGKGIIITTSSGTQAIQNASEARVVLLGSFLNLTAVAKKAWEVADEKSCGLTVAMSGKLGSFSLEDFLCSGAIANLWENESAVFSDSAYASLLAYRSACSNLFESVLKGNHAQELVKIGLNKDVAFCCELDRYDTIPILKEGRI